MCVCIEGGGRGWRQKFFGAKIELCFIKEEGKRAKSVISFLAGSQVSLEDDECLSSVQFVFQPDACWDMMDNITQVQLKQVFSIASKIIF